MKIKSIICATVLCASLASFASCASNKNLKNLEERRSVALKTEAALSEVNGLTTYDAVYTKEKQLRIFVKPESGELSDELVAKIKKVASETNGISTDNIAVFAITEVTADAK